MAKFTQIPQSSEELRVCFNKDTRINGIMTSLIFPCLNRHTLSQHLNIAGKFGFKSEYIVCTAKSENI